MAGPLRSMQEKELKSAVDFHSWMRINWRVMSKRLVGSP
jgi:hypothetical protein